MSRYIDPVPFIDDSNGDPIVGAKLYFYEQGTTTLKTIYSDSDFVTPTTNPQVADASGRFSGDIFLDGTYKSVMKDADDVTIWTKDPVGDVTSGQFTLWLNNQTYNIPEITLGSDDEYYRSLTDSNQGNNPISSAANWEQLQFGRVYNANVTYSAGDSVYGSDGFLYLSRTGSNVGNDPISDTTNWRSGAEVQFTKGADIASATALVTGSDGNYFDVTGTTTVTSITTVGVGAIIKLQFDGALILTHHATDLILPSGANITTAAGDEAEFYEYASGDWRCTNYSKANGRPVASGVAQVVNTIDGSMTTGTTTIPFNVSTPQNTEGDEVMTLAITPTDAASNLIIDVVVNLSSSVAATYLTAALFEDATASANTSAAVSSNAADDARQIVLKYYVSEIGRAHV